MDTLSLRVSSIKTTENLKKNSENKFTILELPIKWKTRNEIDLEFVKKFTEATKCEQQVEAIQMVRELDN